MAFFHYYVWSFIVSQGSESACAGWEERHAARKQLMMVRRENNLSDMEIRAYSAFQVLASLLFSQLDLICSHRSKVTYSMPMITITEQTVVSDQKSGGLSVLRPSWH